VRRTGMPNRRHCPVMQATFNLRSNPTSGGRLTSDASACTEVMGDYNAESRARPMNVSGTQVIDPADRVAGSAIVCPDLTARHALWSQWMFYGA
jgi:hypothetical protein